ncbi:MAG: hypothetical protein ACREJO_00645 [Phycisphaerales bacterium]
MDDLQPPAERPGFHSARHTLRQATSSAPDEIITHELPLDQFAKGFGLMQSGEGIKIVLDVG